MFPISNKASSQSSTARVTPACLAVVAKGAQALVLQTGSKIFSDSVSSFSGVPREQIRSRQSKYYAVQSGFHPGVYETWAECEVEVKGFKGARFRAFRTRLEADKYISV